MNNDVETCFGQNKSQFELPRRSLMGSAAALIFGPTRANAKNESSSFFTFDQFLSAAQAAVDPDAENVNLLVAARVAACVAMIESDCLKMTPSVRQRSSRLRLTANLGRSELYFVEKCRNQGRATQDVLRLTVRWVAEHMEVIKGLNVDDIACRAVAAALDLYRAGERPNLQITDVVLHPAVGSQNIKLSAQDVVDMSKVAPCEADQLGAKGVQSVGAVILNRLANGDGSFTSIHSILNPVEFESIQKFGSVDNMPAPQHQWVDATLEVIERYSSLADPLFGGATFFFEPTIVNGRKTNSWLPYTRLGTITQDAHSHELHNGIAMKSKNGQLVLHLYEVPDYSVAIKKDAAPVPTRRAVLTKLARISHSTM